jgi:hypothetical protein
VLCADWEGMGIPNEVQKGTKMSLACFPLPFFSQHLSGDMDHCQGDWENPFLLQTGRSKPCRALVSLSRRIFIRRGGKARKILPEMGDAVLLNVACSLLSYL